MHTHLLRRVPTQYRTARECAALFSGVFFVFPFEASMVLFFSTNLSHRPFFPGGKHLPSSFSRRTFSYRFFLWWRALVLSFFSSILSNRLFFLVSQHHLSQDSADQEFRHNICGTMRSAAELGPDKFGPPPFSFGRDVGCR